MRKDKKAINQTEIKPRRVLLLTLTALVYMPILAFVAFIITAPFASNNSKVDLMLGCLAFSVFAVPAIFIMWYGVKSMYVRETFIRLPAGAADTQGIIAILFGLFYLLIGIVFFSMMWSFLIDVFVCGDVKSAACDLLRIPEWPFLHIDKIAPYLPKR